MSPDFSFALCSLLALGVPGEGVQCFIKGVSLSRAPLAFATFGEFGFMLWKPRGNPGSKGLDSTSLEFIQFWKLPRSIAYVLSLVLEVFSDLGMPWSHGPRVFYKDAPA